MLETLILCLLCGHAHVLDPDTERLLKGKRYQLATPPYGVECESSWREVVELAPRHFPHETLESARLAGHLPTKVRHVAWEPVACGEGLWKLGSHCPYMTFSARRQTLLVHTRLRQETLTAISDIRRLSDPISCIWVIGEADEVSLMEKTLKIATWRVGHGSVCSQQMHGCRANAPETTGTWDLSKDDDAKILSSVRHRLIAAFPKLPEALIPILTAYAFDTLPNGKPLPITQLASGYSERTIQRHLYQRIRPLNPAIFDAIRLSRLARRKGTATTVALAAVFLKPKRT